MKIRYLVSLVFQSLSNKKLVVIILLAMNTISLYMTDVIATDYISQRHYIESITSMFGTHPQKVNYVEYLNLMNPEYTKEKGEELIEYIRNHENVTACGRFCNSKAQDILNGDSVNALIVEYDITDIGNLGIKKQDVNISGQLNQVYIGYNYKDDFNIGDEFDFYRDSDDCRCVIAGYLKKSASWPLKGNLFNAVSNLDSYTLEDKIVVITQHYEAFDNSGGMPDVPYFIADYDSKIAQLKTDIIKMSAQNNLGVRVVNEERSIEQKIQDTALTQNKSFMAAILLFFLALISMSAASIVFCLIRKRQHGIMLVCGISKNELISMDFLENIIITLLPAVVVWLIRQREIFGRLILHIQDIDMLIYPYWYAHCICLPFVFAAVVIFISFISGVIPAVIINNMSVADVIKR